jgi:hypothetical protein
MTIFRLAVAEARHLIRQRDTIEHLATEGCSGPMPISSACSRCRALGRSMRLLSWLRAATCATTSSGSSGPAARPRWRGSTQAGQPPP